MSDNVVSHPHRDLMAEAKRERKVADSPEAQALQADIYKAVNPYSEFLEREGVIWEFGVREPDFPRMKARALVITLDYGRYCGLEIKLKDGALDRAYGNGVNPDPDGLGPPDIPHKQRSLVIVPACIQL
jgi:hypothetical protein